MQNRGQAQLGQMLKFEAQWSSNEFKVIGHLHKRPQGYAVKRHRITATQRIQVNSVTVVGCNHRKAGQAAFCRLALPDERKTSHARKTQHITFTS